MYRKRMIVLSLSLLAPLLLGLLLFNAVSARRTGNGPPTAPIVDTLVDEIDGNCAPGDCSLRDSIAIATPGAPVTFIVTGTIVVSPTLGDLVIDKDLTIDGGGVITVSGDNKVRVFNVTAGNVTFDSLTIANGNVQTDDCGVSIGECGGGIILQNSGVAVTVTNSTLSGNSALYSGGGISNWGTVTVNNSTLSGNSAGYGGGIRSDGIMTLSSSTLSGNSANTDGGGISIEGGTMMVSNSTLSGNSASHGGGIFSEGTVTVTNSTLSGNSAVIDGGGIHNHDKTVTVDNSTLSGNSAGTGGGISSYGDSQTLTFIGNTIVSGNVISGTTTADDLALSDGTTNSFNSEGYNLIGAIGDNVTSITATGDITNTLTLIGPLADNGGDTFTHALLPGSLAIDNRQCIGGPAADQRGVARPPEGSCDIGAFESRGFSLVLTSGNSQTTAINTPFANPLALTVSSAYNESVEGGQVTFSAPDSGASVTFTETAETIGSGGVVTLPVTANGTTGSYQVVANFIGNNGVGLNYNLTNVLPTYLLTVKKDGSGSGTVTSSPAGINCGSDCSENYTDGTVVTLAAAANTGSAFTGWSGGGCSGDATCAVTMDAAKDITASFAATVTEYNVFLPVVIR